MSALSSTKPDAWTLSPQMTAAPELWRGCTLYLWNGIQPFALSESGIVELTRTGTMAASRTKEGVSSAHTNADSDGGFTVSKNLTPSSDGLTITCLCYYTDPGGWSYVSDARAGTGTWMAFDSGNTLKYNNKDLSIGGSGFVNERILYSILPLTDFLSVWQDGEQIRGAGSGGGAQPKTIGTNCRISARFTDANNFEGDMSLYIVHNRFLSDAEVIRLHADPFAMLRPAGF